MPRLRLSQPTTRIVAAYLVAGCLWIVFSDRLVFLLTPSHDLQLLFSVLKGWCFVVFSAVLLYLLISRSLSRLARANGELAASQERLQMALEASRMGVWDWDLATDRVVWSRECYDITGLREFDGRFASFAPLLHPDDAERVVAAVQRAVADRTPYADEFRIIRPDSGATRWLANMGRVRYDPDGTPLSVYGTVRDVTEERQARDALRTSEERLQLVLDSVDDALWDWDVSSDTIHYSDRYFAIAGSALDGNAGFEGFSALIHPEDRERVAAVVEAHLRGETPDGNVQFRLVNDTGKTRWIMGRGRVSARDADGRPLRMVGTISDVTARVQLEEEARSAAARYRSLFDCNVDGIMLTHPDGAIVSVNRAACSLLGWTETELLSLGRDRVADLADPRLVPALQQRACTGAFSGELTFLRRDGTPFPVDISSVIFRDGEEELCSIIFRDASDRKRADVDLRASEERYRRLFEVESDALFLVDTTTMRFVDVNPAAERMYGYSRAEFLALCSLAAVSAEEEQTRDSIGRREAHVPLRWHRRKDGTPFPVEISGSHFELKGRPLQIAAIRDISERLELERKLRDSERTYRTLVMNVPFLVTTVDEEGIIRFINRCAEGFDAEAVVGTSSYGYLEGDSVPVYRRALARAFATGEPQRFEVRGQGDGGALRWYETVLGPLADGGRVEGVIQVSLDITARKDAEMLLAGLNETLERQVTERTASLSASNARLVREIEERLRVEQELVDQQRKLEAMASELALAEERERDRIAGELHDQVGQRLILGKMKLDALAGQLPPGPLEDEAAGLTTVLEQSIQDIRSLTFQIRPPILSSAGLDAALGWLGEELRTTAGLRVDFSDDGRPKPLRYEVRSMVFQAVRELMLNVVKHAGTLQCLVRSERDGDTIRLVVEDAGVGAVTSAEESTGRSGGYGLHNVRQRIEHLGGSFSLEYLPAGGTRAAITVPLDRSESAPPP